MSIQPKKTFFNFITKTTTDVANLCPIVVVIYGIVEINDARNLWKQL